MSVGVLSEQGQLAQVRGRRWGVAEIEADKLRGDPLQPAKRLIMLRSVEYNAELDESLEVVREVEPGASLRSGRVDPLEDGG